MPVYEYRCAECQQATDLLLPYDRASDPHRCPGCDGPLRRVFSRVAVRLEGWGFTRNDGLVPDRPGGRHDWHTVKERAEKLSETGEL